MSLLRFRPTQARILVEAIHSSPQVGGIHLPERAREAAPAEAMVVALGPKNKLPIKVGDRVLTSRYEGTKVVSGTRMYRLLMPEDLLCVIGD